MAACTIVETTKSPVESRRSGRIMLRKRKLDQARDGGTRGCLRGSRPRGLRVEFHRRRRRRRRRPAHSMVKVPGGTLTIAEAPAAGPNYIFPMMSGAYFSVRTSS